jgi:hypothetical protein
MAFLAAGCNEGTSPDPVAPDGTTLIAAAPAVPCELGVSDAAALLLINDLIAEVDALETAGSLNSGQAWALRNHLENARRQLEAGNICPALAQLEAFREQVGEFVTDGVLTLDEADALLAGARDLIEGPPPFPNRVTIDPPSSAAGTYDATGATFGPAPTLSGLSGSVVLVNDGAGIEVTDGCEPFVGFPAGAIALVDRGLCAFTLKAANAQAAGAIAMIVAQYNAGDQFNGDPNTMGGSDPSITIPSVMISLAAGTTLKAGLPATGTVSRTP